MLTNYNQDQFGVIHQIEKQPLVYSNSYVDSVYQTDNMKVLTRQMAYLRLGFITGIVSKPTSQLSLLDIGFGNGAFLDVAKTAFKTAAGNDIFDNPYLPQGCNRVQELGQDYFDVITMYDSFEHFDELDFVAQLRCNYLIVSVPWCHYVSDAWFDAWKHRKPNEHLHHFDQFSLTAFLLEYGYYLITFNNIEDAIRRPVDDRPNILTAAFRRH